MEKISVSSVSVLIVELPLSEIPPHLLHDDNIVISIAHPQNTEVQNTEGQNEECQRSWHSDKKENRHNSIHIYDNGGGDFKDEEWG